VVVVPERVIDEREAANNDSEVEELEEDKLEVEEGEKEGGGGELEEGGGEADKMEASLTARALGSAGSSLPVTK
jgi:hypothetical protein